MTVDAACRQCGGSGGVAVESGPQSRRVVVREACDACLSPEERGVGPCAREMCRALSGDVRGVRCRRRSGHLGEHRWWDRGGDVVRWSADAAVERRREE